MTKPILDPELVYELLDDIWNDYLRDGKEHLIDTLVELGLMKISYLTERDIRDDTMPCRVLGVPDKAQCDMEVGDEYYAFSLEDITKKLQA